MRLQKYIASCGVSSRRKAEELIKENRVTVNDITISEMGFIVDEAVDIVKVDNVLISTEGKKHYYAFNKPKRVITSASDELGRKNVLDYFNKVSDRLFTVGRLDYESSGLILVTNDGDFANRVTHPKYESLKTYEATIVGHIKDDMLAHFRLGVVIDGYKTSPATIELKNLEPGTQFMQITIKEGRNRQIRKMVELADARVKSLQRISVGPIRLGNLKPGEYRKLSHTEIQYFFSLIPRKKK